MDVGVDPVEGGRELVEVVLESRIHGLDLIPHRLLDSGFNEICQRSEDKGFEYQMLAT